MKINVNRIKGLRNAAKAYNNSLLLSVYGEMMLDSLGVIHIYPVTDPNRYDFIDSSDSLVFIRVPLLPRWSEERGKRRTSCYLRRCVAEALKALA